jgi:hypothetical protein
MEAHERLSELYSSFRTNQNRIESFTARSITSGLAARVARQLITVPVVVHVVSKKAEEDISDSQIKSQIAVLNKDFRATNTDATDTPSVWSGLVADANIQFALATKDPKGKATTGITRTATTRTSFGADDSVKTKASGGAPAWPAGRYLNLWVCNLGGGLLGYAQFPGGPAKTDGVVILHSAFGTSGTAAAPFNLGRTATHEIGHWLNLRHIWGRRERLQRDRSRLGHPERATTELRFAHVPARQLRQRPERRHVHELHGLRRRRRDGDVHARADHADERRARAGPRSKIGR